MKSSKRMTVRNRSEPSFYPAIDILQENVKSSFALGHFRGMQPIRANHNAVKTEIQLKREETYGKANNKAKNKRLTFLKFGFRMHEKKSNYYLQPLIRKVKEAYGEQAIDGSMGVVDLWSDRNVNRLMEAIEMTRDNLLIRRMGQEKQSDVEAFMLTRIEEKKLKDRITMESMKLPNTETATLTLKYQLSDREKQRQMRIAQPTQSSVLARNYNPNEKIQSILENIGQLHEENLEVYTDIYQKLKKIQKHIKLN